MPSPTWCSPGSTRWRPVISARRPPRRGAAPAAAERRARRAPRGRAGAAASPRDARRPRSATLLAAGVQVPIAAGAWLLAWLGEHPTGAVDPASAVWETLRLTPPTWVTARVTTGEVELSRASRSRPDASSWSARCSSAGCTSLVPGDDDGRAGFDPDRWDDDDPAPGGVAAVRRRPARLPGPLPGHGPAPPTGPVGRDRRIVLSEGCRSTRVGASCPHRAASPSADREELAVTQPPPSRTRSHRGPVVTRSGRAGRPRSSRRDQRRRRDRPHGSSTCWRTPRVDVVVSSLTIFAPEDPTGWTRLGGRAWVREWVDPGTALAVLPPPGRGPGGGAHHAVAVAGGPRRRASPPSSTPSCSRTRRAQDRARAAPGRAPAAW